MYADYSFYTGSFGGSYVFPDEFDELERRASIHVDKITFGRLNYCQIPNQVKMAVCAVIEAIKKYTAAEQAAVTAAGLKSENVDGYSVNYQDVETAKTAIDSAMTEAARPYLIYTGLMDRSVCK